MRFATPSRRTAMHSLARLAAAALVALTLGQPAWSASRDEAAAIAARQTGGRVLSVDRADSGRGPVWRVKVVTPKGEVRVVMVEADR
jgi:uncharacterized membrane protein YkoI